MKNEKQPKRERFQRYNQNIELKRVKKSTNLVGDHGRRTGHLDGQTPCCGSGGGNGVSSSNRRCYCLFCPSVVVVVSPSGLPRRQPNSSSRRCCHHRGRPTVSSGKRLRNNGTMMMVIMTIQLEWSRMIGRCGPYGEYSNDDDHSPEQNITPHFSHGP